MAVLATTPQPPYYAVVFSSLLSQADGEYQDAADRMLELAKQQDGFLGVDSVRETQLGVTVSYWRDLDAIQKWKEHAEHRLVRERGRKEWYSAFRLRICRVEREYGLDET